MPDVIVTGGSRGIGLAIARQLAISGRYNVIAVAVTRVTGAMLTVDASYTA